MQPSHPAENQGLQPKDEMVERETYNIAQEGRQNHSPHWSWGKQIDPGPDTAPEASSPPEGAHADPGTDTSAGHLQGLWVQWWGAPFPLSAHTYTHTSTHTHTSTYIHTPADSLRPLLERRTQATPGQGCSLHADHITV